ncbi:MAG: DUF423 domain-containing protein [Proteobacteria bacterium]|nr:DUF423 domain-containing protein [Pseudomonadota bacterium]
MPAKLILCIGGLYGLLAVLLGAFGAHGLREVLPASGLASWQTGVLYQLVHAPVMLIVALWLRQGGPAVLRLAGLLFALGILTFSGSIYALVLLNALSAAWLGPVTPLGGLTLIAGWTCLCIAALTTQDT